MVSYVVRQAQISQSELEWLTHLPSQLVAELAQSCGWQGMYGMPLTVDVAVALNVVILSIFRANGVEFLTMREWLPGLRNEALIILGSQHANWRCDDTQAVRDFFPQLSGGESSVRQNVARLVGVNLFDARALLRFNSPSEVHCLTREQMNQGHAGGAVRFSIYAADLAERLSSVVPKPLFIAMPSG